MIAAATKSWQPRVLSKSTRKSAVKKLLKCHDEPGEYISYSEWEDAAAIETYRKSKDHDVVVSHSRNLQGAKATAKTYEITG